MCFREYDEERTYAERLEEGIEIGRKEGKEEGIAIGEAKGRAEGRAEGEAKGRAEGRAEGEAKGRVEGKAIRDEELVARWRAKGMTDSQIEELLS